ELEYLRTETERELQRDVVRDVLNALLDSLEDPVARIRSESLRCLERFLPQLFSRGDIPILIYALDEVAALAAHEDTTGAAMCEALRRVAHEFAHEILRMDHVVLEQRIKQHPKFVEALLQYVEGEGLEPLLQWLPQAPSALRPVLESAAARVTAKHPDALRAVLKSAEPGVCVGALKIAAQCGDARVAGARMPTLAHAHHSARTEAVLVLTAVGGEAALQRLSDALQDPAAAVRTAAAWGLGSWKHAPAFPRLLAILQGRDLVRAALPEKLAMFDALARTGGDESI